MTKIIDLKILKEVDYYIGEIAKLPEPLGFLLETKNEEWIFNKCRQTNEVLALWLRHNLFLEPLDPLALENNGWALVPLADFFEALLYLCFGVHDETPIWESFVELWFLIIKRKADNAVDFLGLTGNPALKGKVDYVKAQLELIKKNEELPTNCEDCTEPNDPELKLYYRGRKIADRNHRFYKKYWKPFTDARAHYFKCFRDSKHLQFPYLLSDGSLYLTSGNGRIPKIQGKRTK